MSKQRALIDINMLLDTRDGVIRQIDSKIADALVGSNVYRKRHHDNFDLLTNGQVSREQYQEMYNAFDADTLGASKMTDFVYHFRQDMVEAANRMERGVGITDISVDINLYPYNNLMPEEITILRRSIRRYIPSTIPVNMINVPWSEITPSIVNRSYEMMAIYNHEDWLIPNQKLLIEQRLPTTVLLTPTIASSGELPPPEEGVENPFSARALVLVKFIALTYLPTEYVCHNPFIRLELQNLKRQEQSQRSPAPPAGK